MSRNPTIDMSTTETPALRSILMSQDYFSTLVQSDSTNPSQDYFDSVRSESMNPLCDLLIHREATRLNGTNTHMYRRLWDLIDEDDLLEVEFRREISRQSLDMACRGRVAILNSSGHNHIHGSFATHLEEGRIPDGVEFAVPSYLLELGARSSLQLYEQQLIIVEDIGRDWIEILAVAFEIPIHVFALHWANPLRHAQGTVRLPLGQDFSQHCILSYRETLPLRIESKHMGMSSVKTFIRSLYSLHRLMAYTW